MRRVIYILALLAMLTGCTKTIYVPQVSRQVVIDTLIEVVPDSSIVRALLECDSTGRVLISQLNEQKGEMASTQFTIEDNSLTAETRWRTKVVERIVELRDTTSVIEYKEVVKEVSHVPTIYKWALWIAIALLGTTAIKIILWLKG